MIEVRIRPERIKISGHAGYAEPGKDIVCAAVTALTQTLIQSIENLTDDEIEYRISPGKAEIDTGICQRNQKLWWIPFLLAFA